VRYGLRTRTGLLGAFNFNAVGGLLLDVHPNSLTAYSLRKLTTSYTGSVIRVRRSSDNAQQDIGFVNDALDQLSLLTFVGGGNGFVTTWYDQSGNGHNATSTVAAEQPQIVSSGVILTQNSKPTLVFDGTDDYLRIVNSIDFFRNVGYVSCFALAQTAITNTRMDLISSAAAQRLQLAYSATTNNRMRGLGRTLDADAAALINSNTDFGTSMKLFTLLNKHVLGTNFLFQNGVQEATGNLATTGNTSNTQMGEIVIGRNSQPSTTLSLNGRVSELLLYAIDLTATRANIESNIMTFYNV